MLLAGLCFNTSVVRAQETNFKVAAIYIYSFTKYIEWPANKMKNRFIIDVYGNSALVNDLIMLTANKKVNGLPIEINTVYDENEIQYCNILFVPNNKSDKINELIEASGRHNFLLVTEGKNLTKKGAAISLVNIGGKQKFELNEAAIKKVGLKIANQLVSLSISPE